MTDIDSKKQALAIHLALSGKARQASSEIEVEDLCKDSGVNTLLAKLDKLFLLDESRRQFKAFQELYNLKRNNDEDVCEFVIKFETIYYRFKQERMELPDAVMAFMLLASCSLSDTQFQLVMSSVPSITYEYMKSSLKRIFGGKIESAINMKEEPVLYNEVKDDNVYFGNPRNNIHRGHQTPYAARSGRRPKFTGNYRGGRSFTSGACNRRLNPMGQDGKPSKCAICDSKFHWAKSCPHAYERNETEEQCVEESREYVQLSLLTGYTDDTKDVKLENLMKETYGSAILDTGCSTTVCGEKWLNNYIECLSQHDKAAIKEESTTSSFTFGDGRSIKSNKCLVLPCYIAGMRSEIKTDVVPCEIPLLMSKAAMKRAKMLINFENDSAVICGRKVKLISTASGHYCLPLSL